jgi:hypothetical protein
MNDCSLLKFQLRVRQLDRDGLVLENLFFLD